MKMTRHFREDILGRDRPYIKREWCEQALKEPEYTEVQPNGSIRHWVYIEELGKYFRVVTRSDKETIITAHPDRRFKGGNR